MLRFSLRRLLIVFTLLAVAIYIVIVRPTQVANRFVQTINTGNFHELRTLGMLDDLQSYDKNYTFENVTATAELRPRTWRDLYKLRRKIWVNITFPKGHPTPESSLVNYVVAHLSKCTWGEEP